MPIKWIILKYHKNLQILLKLTFKTLLKLHLLPHRLCHCWLPLLEGASLLEALQHAFHLSQTTATAASLHRQRHKISWSQINLYSKSTRKQGKPYLWKLQPLLFVLWAGLSDKHQWSVPTWLHSCPAESQSVDFLHPGGSKKMAMLSSCWQTTANDICHSMIHYLLQSN